MANILIVDDDTMLCHMVMKKLRKLEHQACLANTLKDGIQLARESDFDLVLLDVRLPDGSGLEEIPTFTSQSSNPEIIIITGEGDPEGARLAIETGAWDYIEKPLSMREIILQLNQVLLYRREKNKNKRVTLLDRAGIIGDAPALTSCLQQLAYVAPTDAPVIVTGETGTGKELFARAVHLNSNRADQPFVVLDCAAFPENLVESILFGHEKGAFTGADTAREGLIMEADGGTLFMDEVGELPMAVQKTFLRVLQEQSFRSVGGTEIKRSNFRLVAATNRNLGEMVEAGTFRKDLLFRLESAIIKLPPLKARQEDIEQLTLHLVNELCKNYKITAKGISREFLSALKNYNWPGNVRELTHTIDNAIGAARMHDTLFPKHLPPKLRIGNMQISSPEENLNQVQKRRDIDGPLPNLKEALEREEKLYLEKLMKYTVGNIKESCQISGLSRSGLYSRLKKFGIERPN